MKNLLNNLLNWVLKKGSSETKKEQAWEEKEQAGSKKEQAGSKKDQVKRTKLSEKDQVKRTKLSEKDQVKRTKLSEKDQVKRTKLEMASEAMSVKGSEAVSANHALITQLSRTNHPISLRAIRYAAVLFMVFMVGVGNVWGTNQTYTISTPTAARNVSGNVLITGTVASKKVKNKSSTACFYVASGSYAPVTIASKSANIKSITIKGNRDTGSSDNTVAAFNVLTSSDLATFTTPTEGFTATKDNNGSSSSVASLSSIPMVGNDQSYVTEVTISFDSPVMGIELTYSNSTSFSYISVTYDDAITAPSVLCEAHATSTTAYGGTGCTVTTDGVQEGVTISTSYYYNKLSGDAKYIKLDLGSGKSFAVGDEIWIECNGNGIRSEGAKLNSSASATGATAAVSAPSIGSGVPMWVRCVTVAASPWKNQQSLYVLRNSSNSRIYQVEVRRAAGSCAATANAGADKETTVGVGVAMAATAASSGYTGAWSIKSGSPSTATSQLGTTSSNVMTFTPNTYGTYTLVWTVTSTEDGTCKATDEATVTVPAPTHEISYTNTKGAANSNPATYSEGTGIASFAKLRHVVGYDFTGWSPSSISSSATTDQTIEAQWTANAVAEGTASLTYALAFSSGSVTTSSITRVNGALYDATDVSLEHTSFNNNSTSKGCSGKLVTTTAKDNNNYVEVTFKIADGYTFTPTEVRVQGIAVSNNKTIEVELTDNAATPNSKSVSGTLTAVDSPTSGGYTVTLDFDASGEITLEGTVTVKIFAYGNTDHWRMGTPFVITGTVAAAAGATYKLGGDWNSYSEHTMTVSEGVASYSVDLAADTRYDFYVKENSTAYKSNGTIVAPGGWVFTTGENNAHIHTGPAGTYTFSMNTSTHAVSVTYPEVTHPSDHYVYFKNALVWGSVKAYLGNSGNDNKAAAWPGSPTATTTICGQIYHYAALNSMSGTYNLIIFSDGYSGDGHQSWNLSTTGSAGKYNANVDANWYDPAISITFDKNGGTGSMEKIVGLCSGDNKTLPSNTFTRTGWEFDGWNTDKYGGGTPYEDGETIEGITANITLYAQWKKTVYVKSSQSAWYKDGDDDAWFAIYYWKNGSDPLKNGWVAMTRAEECSDPAVYKATLPGNGYDKLIFVTKKADSETLATWENKVNQTVDIDYPTTNDQYSISTTSDGNYSGSWGTYSIPTYTISYNKGTNGSGSKSSQTKTCGVAFTLPGSTFTYAGHTQDGWATADGGAIAYALSGSYTTNDDEEFFPHWKCNTPEISCSSNTITITVPTGATVYYTTTTDGSTPADPTSSSTAYNPSSKPTISADTKIKAIAIQSGCTNSAIASASLTYVAPGPSYTAPTSALDISAQTSVTAAGLITANNATQSYYLSTNTDTLLLIPSDIYYNIGNGKKNTWAKANGSPSTTSDTWTCPAGSVSFKGRTWWKSSGNINSLKVRSDNTLNIRVKGCKTVSVLNKAASETKYFILEAYEYDDGYKSSDPDVSANNKSTSVTETSLSLNSSKEYVIVLRASTTDNVMAYEIKFIAPSSGYTVSIAANPAGYGSVSSSSVTSVASGTTLSASTNTLSVGATNVTATETSASAEYTYAFSNWTKSDGTALPSTVTADLSVYANFTRTANNYTLTWSSNGGSELSGDYTSGSTAYGAAITAPNDPTLSNYTFDGWKTNNDGTGTTAGATMPAANTTYYAAWKQTVTLTTGAQGEGGNQTPYVYLNGTGVSSFTPHTASGYTLQGYYTAGSGGVKVLNADGTFASANVDGYITSSKWSRTGAAPTLYAQWVAAEDCHTLKYVWKVTGNFCDDQSTSTSSVSMITTNDYFTLSGSNYSQESGASLNVGKSAGNYFLLTAKSGYEIKSVCIYGKIQDSKAYKTTDNSDWSGEITSTNTSGDAYYSFGDLNSTYFGMKSYGNSGFWIRNMVIEICAAGGATYSVTYDDNGKTGGSVPTDATNYSYGGTVTVKGNTGSLAKTNYTFAGWTTNNDGTGSSYVEDNTFSITANTTLYAKWTQAVTFDANTANHGSTGGSATAVWNATGLTGITHATPASGYKLLGYYTAATEGTKVLNSDGTFAGTAVTGYITDGKWTQATSSSPTLYAQYEAAGALIWNLGVNTEATSLTTSSKESSFTQIAVANMGDATLSGSTYSKSAKSSLTGKISSPATKSDYVYVTFKVADGYKFTPSNISVKVQPVGENEHKAVELSLADATNTLASSSATKCDGTEKGKTTTVTLAGNGTYFTGTVMLKIYVYDFSGSATGTYRLGTPIQIDGEVEALCATMPSFTQMNYSTTTFAPSADASGSPITIVGGENIDTYQWKYNTTNDRTSGTDCGSDEASLDPLTNAAAAIDGTRYYWCEMTNDACGITIKSPAVAITVASAKSDATVTWTGTAASANYGGGGYTVTATVSTAEWDGTLTEDMLTAMDGVVLSNINVTNGGKTITADFGVTEGANAEATNVEFYLNHPATTGYNAIDATYNTTTLVTSCISDGGGDGSSYDVRVRKITTTILQGKSTVYGWDTPTKGFVTQNTGGSVTSGKSGYDDVPVFDSISKGNAKAYWVKSYVANVKKIRVYGQVGDDDLTATGVYHVGSFVAGGSSTAVAYSVVYEDEVDALKKGNHWFEITLDEAISTNDIIYFTVNKNFKIMGVRLTTVGAGGATLETALSAWSPVIDTRKEVNEDAASFVETVTKTGVNANTMGAITYSSGDETIATVDNRTGRVTIANSITWGDAITYKDVTITASLAPSGCYQGKTATYTLRVNKLTCTEAAGTITASSEGSHVVIEGDEVKKCTSETVTLTLGGYEEGATSFQWYKDDVLQGDKTTASITTADAGVWYAVSNKGCAVTSTNEITISNKSTEVHVTRLVKEWYIKNGRLTPDIALWQLGEGETFVSVTASDGWDAGTGLTEAELGEKVFYEKDGIVYLKGTEPKANAGAVQNYTLTLTVNDGCGNQTLDVEEKKITIHHQQNTDKHVLAFVVNGTEKGDWTAGVTADQTTNVGLYNAIAAQFDVQATNIYATDDEKKLKEYYSQYDILCITDYPNTQTKGVNKKSYVDAIGSLIDIRPILTMEAFVSKLANWKAKGISGNPKSPTTRQYTMDLQCKDHEIFAGTKLTKVGEGDEAMYRVSMVDNTLEDYATLDATYGAILPHKEKESKSGAGDGEYNYGGKPALQGFTFTQEMIDNDLLPIGLIDDGAGNPLQVGIERQHNMEARLMVLGINSYAMERLTGDGERVVINALNYLMKKNAEDIADCSTSFVGGAEGHEKDWDNADNWTGNTVPLPTQKVRILADCEVSSTVYAQSVLIVTGGKYNHGSDDAAGKLTIKENGALIVGGKIQAALAPAYNRPRATTPDKLLIETSDEHQAALIFDNEEAETQATVKLYSLGHKPSSYQYQYFAVPMEVVPVNPTFANETHGGTGIYTYVYSEATSGWTRRKYYDDLFAFEGLGITTKSATAMEYEMTGTLASTATKEITLTHADKGLNLIGNSWMAPIQIGALAEDNAGLDNQTAYIYCAGRDAVEGAATSGDTETAGQWIAIPFEAAAFATWRDAGKLSVIPAMQAFQIKVADEATLTLDYDKVVRGSTNDLNAKLRAPGRRMAANEVTMTNIRVADSKTHTDLSLFEGDRFSEAFDNGWEAEYMNGDGRSAKLYAETEAGQMAVVAMYDYEGTVVGFAPGQETEYTFSFMGEDNGYYLNDIKLQNSVRISEGETYTFTYEEGDAANRFYISRTAINAPEVATGMENLDAAVPRVQKIIYNDKLYIIRGGRLYDATGRVVK